MAFEDSGAYMETEPRPNDEQDKPANAPPSLTPILQGNEQGPTKADTADANEEQQTAQGGTSKQDLWAMHTCVATIVIAAATTIYMAFAGWQLWVMKGQLKQMKTASRAWVGLSDERTPLEVGDLRIDGAGTVHVDGCAVWIKNFGDYPAQDVFTVTKLVLTQTPASAQKVAQRMRARYANHPKGTALFPGPSGRAPNWPSMVLPSGIIRIPNGGSTVNAYIVGCILYRDQSGERHHTTFVYQYFDRSKSLPVDLSVNPDTPIAAGEWVEYVGCTE
jgi:hypothetical protein